MQGKDYEFKTPEQVVEELLDLPTGVSIDFTFDTPEDAEFDDFEPSGWYGVKIKEVCEFDNTEFHVLFGDWGFGIIHDIKFEYEPDLDDKEDIVNELLDFAEGETSCKWENGYLCVSKKYNGQ